MVQRTSGPRPLLRRGRGAVSLLLAVAALSAATGCGRDATAGGEASQPLPAEAFRELATPAGPGSGEPYLAAGPDGVWLSWIEPSDAPTQEETIHDVRLARLDGDTWADPVTVARGDDFFVNWADFPSVTSTPDGGLLAHWLQRGGSGATYDYGVRVARSHDGGATWSEPWTPHEDGTPTEHGFLSFTGDGEGGTVLVWLDGRRAAEGAHEMTLRARTLAPDGTPGPETLVDDLICDCCQTDAALTDAGPVVVYRDRTRDEVRDVYVTRRVDGAWEAGRPVHADGWVMPACPVNGPAVAARGRDVAVAWFAAPGEDAQVKVAFSRDAGATFGAPVRLDAGAPGGRVDVALLDGGDALVTWIERVQDGEGEAGAEVRARRASPDGRTGPPRTLTPASDARASGFPRMASAPGGGLVVAWTDVLGEETRVRVARLDPAAIPGGGR